MGGTTTQTLSVAAADVWIAWLDPSVGHEQRGCRPVAIVSSELLHEIPSALVFAVPFTTRSRGVASHVPVALATGELPRPSFAMTEQIRAISVLRLRRRVGSVDEQTLEEIRRKVMWFLESP